MDDWRKFLEDVAKAVKAERDKGSDINAIRRMWDDALKRMEESDEPEAK